MAASVKVFHVKVTVLLGVTPGSTADVPGKKVTELPKTSLPVHFFNISAPAALKVLWPEMYSGNAGVGKVLG